MSSEANDSQIHDYSETICLICQSAIAPDETEFLCPSCNKPYHAECWDQNKGCAVYGCSQVPHTEPLNELEIPVSYWGQEKKACPSCGQEILAAALRCLHCGTIFSSARPVSPEEFQGEAELKTKKSKLQREIIIIFILSILTFTAPLGVISGLVWYGVNKKKLKSLAHIYTTLFKIGQWGGLAQTGLIIILGIFYAVFHG